METNTPKNLYIATFGCQMNVYDSRRMQEVLYPNYILTDQPWDADLILVNTCSIREKAEHKAYSLLGRFKELKKQRPGLIIGVGGCVAQQEGERLLKRFPHLDLVFGPQGIYKLPEAIRHIELGDGPALETALKDPFEIPPVDTPLPGSNPVKAFVTIMQGCDNFCTYCVVPHVRGREVSRPAEDIIREVQALVEQGVKDITLLGQNVNSYGKKRGGTTSFPDLLFKVSKVPGLERLRFTTSHPKDFTYDCIEAMEMGLPVCDHLHLPAQSGSNQVLKRMNRHYTREQYLEIVEEVRKRLPDVSITTDIIVGFPGETDKDFEDTLNLLKEVAYDQIFAFKYSPRPFTRAAGFPDQVDETLKRERLSAVLELQEEIGLRRLSRFQGKRVSCLVEAKNPVIPGQLIGRTTGNHVVNFQGPEDLVGRTIDVMIEQACHHSLKGRID